MSEAVTELGGKVAEGWVTVRDAGLRGMITLRGDLDDAVVQRACAQAAGVAFPQERQAVAEGQSGIAWMAPDEVLILVPYAQAEAKVAELNAALEGQHFMAKNVSDARTVMFVEGAGAREVLAKLAPVDMHADHLPLGEMRRTRLGQVAAAFWARDAETFEVICFRSVGDYCFSLLAASAEAGPVGAL